MPAVTADRFLDALRQSGLLPADRLDAQVRRSAAQGPPEDAAELADRFVRDGLLTPFQAERLLQGRWQDLLIADKYAVLALLGVGGMGQVYLCEHLVLRRRSAVKLLPVRLTSDPVAVERFHREARAVAALDHPNIVRAYDVDSADELHFLVMEYVDGVSLQELVDRLGPIDPAAAANYIVQAARGLQHAHEGGWVHRDIKPANLLLDHSGTVKVLDLGLARLLGDDAEPLTAATDALGTADYLAPEQGDDSHAVDIRADIYSLGATLYFLLTGKPPFAVGTPAQKVLWHQTRPARPIQELRPEVPAGMAEVLDRMLAKEPGKRYADPAAVAAALEPWAAGGPFPPPTDLMTTAASASRSGALSSWARHAGSSASTRTVAKKAGETAAVAGATGRVAPRPAQPTPASKGRFLSHRWSVVAGAVAILAIPIAAMFWPKTPAPAPIVPVQAPPVELAGEIQHFTGHTGAIEKVAFTPDGKRLLTASQDKTARVWDVATGQLLHELTGHTDTVRGLEALPDNRRMVTASWDGTVRLWDLDEGKEIRQYLGHKGQVWWVTCDAAGRQLLTTGRDKTVRLWDVESGDELKKFSGFTAHKGTVTAAIFLPDGRRAVTSSEDQTVRLWDLETGEQKNGMMVLKPIYRLSLCPNGRWVFFGRGHDLVRWDPDGMHHATRIATSETVEGAVCVPDGRAVVACTDGTIRVLELNPDHEVHKFTVNAQAVLSLAVAPDGKHFASGGRDKVARLWRLP